MRKTFSLVAALVVLAFALSAKAGIILNLEGFKGESSAKGHPGAISALRFSLELTAHESATGGAGAGKATFKPLVITREIDAASPQLLHALTSNEFFKTLTLELVKPSLDGKESAYYTVKLVHVVISDIHQYTDEHNANLEDVSFSYEKLEVETPGESPAPSETPVNKRPAPIFRPLNK